MIQLTHLYKRYPSPNQASVVALDDVNLAVQRGEIFGIIGESGAGKSTLIRCVNLLEPPDAGQVIVDHQDLTKLDKKQLRQVRRKIGMIFQHFNLLSTRTVYQNIAFPLELAGMPKSIIADTIHPLLELTGLTARKNYYPSQLSGGQKQRVAIARALANKPHVLLSDEATSALDPETKHSILQLLKEINEKLGLTILLITHEMQVIKEVCHRLAILEHGKIIEQSNVLDFFVRANSTAAKKFTRSVALHDLPEALQKRLVTEPNNNTMPLWRLSFFGKAAEAPFITHLARVFALDLNILEAHIERIRNETVGVMLVEPQGEQAQIKFGLQYLTQKGIHVEVIGHVRNAD